MKDDINCSNCGTGFGKDYGAVGNRCPACKQGAIQFTEDN